MGVRRYLGAAAALLAPLLAACDQGPKVVTHYHRGEIVASTMVHASKSGPILAEIWGDPYGFDAEVFAETVRAHMTAGVMGRVVRFTGTPHDAFDPEHKVVMIFGAPRTLNGRRLCAGEVPPPQPRAGAEIAVRAVFCSGGELLADAEAVFDPGPDPGNPALEKTVVLLTRAVLS